VTKNGNSPVTSLKLHDKIMLGNTDMLKAKKPDGNYISLKISRASIDALVDAGASQSLMSENFTIKHNANNRQSEI